MKKTITLLMLLQISFLDAQAMGDMSIDMRDKNNQMLKQTTFEKVHYFTPKKIDIRKKIVYDEFKNIVSETEYHYSTKKIYQE